MRLSVALIACAALIAGCGEDDEGPAATPAAIADLVVEVEPGGKRATVRCNAPEDCAAIAAVKPEAFESTPGNVACTQQYGGPETATVKGTFKGEDVDAKFSRQNGCEIARWEDAKPILEAAK
jgi:nitrous oxide reductase accessory protein NosL